MPIETLAQRIALLAPAMHVVRPEGEGPFPVIVMMHGCGGRQRFMERYAASAARETGAASIIVDSYAPRGISKYVAYGTVCTGLTMWGRERAGDLFAAIAWARAQNWADPDRIFAAGWSHGGWTILDALALRSGDEMRRATRLLDLPDEPLSGLVGCFLAYPYAGRASFAGRRPWRMAPRTTAIIGGRDYIVGSDVPRAALEGLRRRGAPIEVHYFEDATHAFDSDEAVDARVRFNPEHTARAEVLLLRLLSASSSPVR